MNIIMFLNMLISGILLGGMYASFSVGLSLIWGVLNVINLAHGEMLIMGAYISFILFTSLGLDPIISTVVAGLLLFIFGYILQKYWMEGIVERIESEYSKVRSQIISLLAVSMIIQNVLAVIFSVDYVDIKTDYWASSITAGGIYIPITSLVTFSAATIMIAALYVMLKRTDLGRAIRAVMADRDASTLVGVRVKRIFALCFAIGTAICGMTGALLPVIFTVTPYHGFLYLGKAFAITAIVIATKNITFAFWGGLILGIAENLLTLILPLGYKEMVSGIMLLIVLMARPTMN